MHSSRRMIFVALLIGVFVGVSTRAFAQEFGDVFAFRSSAPDSTPVQGRDGYLYGTTISGSGNPCGTIYRVSTSGVGGTLFDFDGTTECYPIGGLTLATDGNFYGVAYGGTANQGVLFRLTPAGWYTVVTIFRDKVMVLIQSMPPFKLPTEVFSASLKALISRVREQSTSSALPEL